MMSTVKDTSRQLLVFCGVGSINTIFGLAVILVLSEGLGVQYMLANIIGYLCGLCLAFVLHRTITFKNASDRNKIKSEFFSFAAIFIFAYAVQFAALTIFVERFSLPVWISQILAIGIYTITNYAGNRVLTFRHKRGHLS